MNEEKTIRDEDYLQAPLEEAGLANLCLAYALGYKLVTSYGSFSTGIPPGKTVFEVIPDWAGSWDACAPLMIKYQFGIKFRASGHVYASGADDTVEQEMPSFNHANYFGGDQETAARVSIMTRAFHSIIGTDRMRLADPDYMNGKAAEQEALRKVYANQVLQRNARVSAECEKSRAEWLELAGSQPE